MASIGNGREANKNRVKDLKALSDVFLKFSEFFTNSTEPCILPRRDSERVSQSPPISSGEYRDIGN